MILDGNRIDFVNAKNAVLVDVFRATTSIVVMLSRGAYEIIPFENKTLAMEFFKNHGDYILVGEQDGIKIEDFDYGNSPSELMGADLMNKKIIFVSTNGTRILKKIRAERVYIASFLNADSVANIISGEEPIVCANRINLFSIEDFLCASYIRAMKLGININFERIKKIIMESPSADRLRKLNAEEDIELSLRLNLIPIIPVYESGRIILLEE